MLNIAYVCWPSICLLWRNVCLDLPPIFFLIGCLFIVCLFVLILSYMKKRKWKSFSRVWLRDTIDCSLPGSLSIEFSSKSTTQGFHFLLQGIFPTQGVNPGLLHCRQTLPFEPPEKPWVSWAACIFWRLILYRLLLLQIFSNIFSHSESCIFVKS